MFKIVRLIAAASTILVVSACTDTAPVVPDAPEVTPIFKAEGAQLEADSYNERALLALSFPDVQLKTGQSYQLEFEAKTDTAGAASELTVDVIKDGLAQTKIDLSDTYQRHSFEFENLGPEDNSSTVRFFTYSVKEPISVRNVVLTEASE